MKNVIQCVDAIIRNFFECGRRSDEVEKCNVSGSAKATIVLLLWRRAGPGLDVE